MLFIRDKRKKAKFIKKHHLIRNMGENCGYQPNDLPSEPELLCIHNNVFIAANVKFYTHDITCDVFNGDERFLECGKHKFFRGTIEIYDNVFIGGGSIITYNTKIGPNAIVAAGSVVVKDVPEGAIVGGNPAKIIGNIENLVQKRAEFSKEIADLNEKEVIEYLWKTGEKNEKSK